ncbi:MAG: hypothetical protein M1835_000934 [Candelina submexicana]|nr:MAG: hypothetical protein M1835_000934 [Candelina submexicana]
MMEYFNYRKAKLHQAHHEKSEAPVISEEDEAFLNRIASEGTPPPLPSRPTVLTAGDPTGNEMQVALKEEAEHIPLPETPDIEEESSPAGDETEKGAGKGKGKAKKSTKWSFLRRDSRDRSNKNKQQAGADLGSAAAALKAAEEHAGEPDSHEAHKEEEDMTILLDKLNLAAVNNRVFSISSETRDVLEKFNLILKDLINGVPTAYDDLESLLTNSENQLQRSYSHLPSFIQKLIQTLPSKMTGSLVPEMLAAAAEKQGLNTAKMEEASEKKKKGSGIPSLKDLVTKPGAVAGMLRAIMNFLKLRFPAFLGMNVLWGLALFILLFVFWYCHKRGKETRLEKERLLSKEESKEIYESQIHSGEDSTTGTDSRGPPESEPQSAITEPDPEMEDIEKYLDAAAVQTEAELKRGK